MVWYNEKERHSLASRGISSKQKLKEIYGMSSVKLCNCTKPNYILITNRKVPLKPITEKERQLIFEAYMEAKNSMGWATTANMVKYKGLSPEVTVYGLSNMILNERSVKHNIDKCGHATYVKFDYNSWKDQIKEYNSHKR